MGRGIKFQIQEPWLLIYIDGYHVVCSKIEIFRIENDELGNPEKLELWLSNGIRVRTRIVEEINKFIESYRNYMSKAGAPRDALIDESGT
jgi:hypothetical protein